MRGMVPELQLSGDPRMHSLGKFPFSKNNSLSCTGFIGAHLPDS